MTPVPGDGARTQDPAGDADAVGPLYVPGP
jgi:hypothetical protein